MTDQPPSLLARTGQRPAALLAIYAGVVSIVLMLASPVLLPKVLGIHWMDAFWASATMAFVCFGFAIARVRCPKCGLHWVWWAMSHQARGKWLPWLRTFTACPRCGLSLKNVP